MSVSAAQLRQARWILARGGVVAYPTEAVYGLGCDPDQESAVRHLLALKRRDVRHGLILIAAEFAAVRPYVRLLAAARMDEIFATWPGPYTWLLPAHPRTPRWLTGAHDTLAVRVTAHPVAAALCSAWGGALVSTSANLTGRSPARTALQVRRRLAALPDLVLHAPCGGAARPSIIRDGRSGRVLRA